MPCNPYTHAIKIKLFMTKFISETASCSSSFSVFISFSIYVIYKILLSDLASNFFSLTINFWMCCGPTIFHQLLEWKGKKWVLHSSLLQANMMAIHQPRNSWMWPMNLPYLHTCLWFLPPLAGHFLFFHSVLLLPLNLQLEHLICIDSMSRN